MIVKTKEEEQRRVNAILYLAKVRPVRYAARYVQGRLELFQNTAWDIQGKYGQWYCWQKFKT